MSARDLPERPDLAQYKKQAKDLLKAWRVGDSDALARLEHHPLLAAGRQAIQPAQLALSDAQVVLAREHGFDSWPTFSDAIAKRVARHRSDSIWKAAEDAIVAGDVRRLEQLMRDHEPVFRNERPRSFWNNTLSPDYGKVEPRLIIASTHSFESWEAFAAHAAAVKDPNSPVARFEAAVDAIVAGDLHTLQQLLERDPDLIRARSLRSHHSMLLHYIGANGVEGFRQHTPNNAVQIADALLAAGADVDARADMYGGSTTLGLVATSLHPKRAGVQGALMGLLLMHGAQSGKRGAGGGDVSLVTSCLANGRGGAAMFLAERGAPLDLESAAGVGRLDLVASFFNEDGSLKPTATPEQMRDGFTWACEFGQTPVVEYLLDRGMDVNTRLPRHHGQTGLHWASHGGCVETVKLLLRRGASVDTQDERFGGTPLAWALHGLAEEANELFEREAHYEVVALLVAAGSAVSPLWLTDENVSRDERLLTILRRGRTGSAAT
jgi:ankyrin repeat protein